MKKTICLVDDEVDFTELLGSLLNFNGFEVGVENDPVEGFERLKTTSYDAIVIDMMMPGMDGMQLVRGLRASKTHERTPLFVLSAKELSDDERTALLAEKAHFVAKPFDPRRLVELIRGAMPE